MQKHELKAAIKALATEIKDLKVELCQNHNTVPNASGKQYSLWAMRKKIRVMYLVYGWYRGKRADQVETGPIQYEELIYEIKVLLERDEERVELFKDWLKSTMKP